MGSFGLGYSVRITKAKSRILLAVLSCALLLPTDVFAQRGTVRDAQDDIKAFRKPDAPAPTPAPPATAAQPAQPEQSKSNDYAFALREWVSGDRSNPWKLAHDAILKNFDPIDCPAVARAAWTNDGTIIALCSNGEKFRVFRWPVNGKIIAMRCSAMAEIGIKGC